MAIVLVDAHRYFRVQCRQSSGLIPQVRMQIHLSLVALMLIMVQFRITQQPTRPSLNLAALGNSKFEDDAGVVTTWAMGATIAGASVEFLSKSYTLLLMVTHSLYLVCR